MWHISGAPTGWFLCIHLRNRTCIYTKLTSSQFLSQWGYVTWWMLKMLNCRQCENYFDTYLYFIFILFKPLLTYCLKELILDSGPLWHIEISYVRLWIHIKYLLVKSMYWCFGLLTGFIDNKKNIEASFPLIILSEKMFTLICANLKAFIKTG